MTHSYTRISFSLAGRTSEELWNELDKLDRELTATIQSRDAAEKAVVDNAVKCLQEGKYDIPYAGSQNVVNVKVQTDIVSKYHTANRTLQDCNLRREEIRAELSKRMAEDGFGQFMESVKLNSCK